MSNREDYLDSLLRSVTEPEKKAESRISAEDEFLMQFDQELLDLDEEDFLKEFDASLEEKPESGDLDDMNPDNVSLDDINLDDVSLDDMNLDDVSLDNMNLDDVDLDNMNMDDPGMDDLMINTMDQDDFAGLDLDPDLKKHLKESAEELAKEDAGELAEQDIDAMLMAAMGAADFETTKPEPGFEQESESDVEPGTEQESEMDDSELLDILAGMTSDDDLADIGNMLKAHDADEIIERDEFPEGLEEVFGQPDNEPGEIDTLSDDDLAEAGGEKKRKKNKKDKKDKKDKSKKDGEESSGFFKKIGRILFGDDDEDVVVPEAGEMENISDENMEILKEMEKKEQKEQKKKEKQAKKEQKKKEKQEKKEQKKKEPKPKKEKKPKEPKPPKEKSKPLPKAPVILILFMAASIVILIFLGSNLVGYSIGMEQAKSSYDQGDYVAAYEQLRGMDMKAVDQEFYDRTRLTAYLQKGLDSYEAYSGREMYPEALDALICTVGKYDKYINEAEEAGAEQEYETMIARAEASLSEDFGVTVAEAREVYGQESRNLYTERLYELLERAGLAE